MSKLPNGWAIACIGDLADLNPKQVFDDETVAGFVPMSHAPTNFRDKLRFDERPWGEIKKAYTNFKDGDVIFAKVTPCFENGKAAFVEGLPNGLGAGSSEFFVLRPSCESISAKYLLALIKSYDFLRDGAANMTGAVGLRRVPRQFVESYLVPVPPAAEQARIAARVDELLIQVDTLKARMDGIPTLLKRFRQSVLAAAVSGRLSEEWRAKNQAEAINLDALDDVPRTRRGVPVEVKYPEILNDIKIPDDWILASAAKLLKKGVIVDLKDGNHGTNHPKASDFTIDGLPFITAANISSSGEVDYMNAPKVSGAALARLRVGFSEPGDVIFTHKGTVGRVAINNRDCVLTPQTTYYRLNQKILLNKYLAIFLRSSKFRMQTDIVKSQTTRDFIPITAQYELFHIIPPILEQFEIVRCVEQLFALADQLETRVTFAQTRINHLTQSVLAKAFRGELVPQDSDDEPATLLLERIKAQRETARAKRGRQAANLG